MVGAVVAFVPTPLRAALGIGNERVFTESRSAAVEMDSELLVKARSARRTVTNSNIFQSGGPDRSSTTVNNCWTEFSDTHRRIAQTHRPKLFYRKSLPAYFINNIQPTATPPKMQYRKNPQQIGANVAFNALFRNWPFSTLKNV